MPAVTMARGKKVLLGALVLAGLWVGVLAHLAYRHAAESGLHSNEGDNFSLQGLPWHDPFFTGAFAAPFLALALFGAYALATVTWQVVQFEDKKEAAAELAKDLITARAELQRRGYQFAD